MGENGFGITIQFSQGDWLKEISVKFNLLFGSVNTGLERKGFRSLLYCGNFLFLKITKRHKVLIDYLCRFGCAPTTMGIVFCLKSTACPELSFSLKNL